MRHCIELLYLEILENFPMEFTRNWRIAFNIVTQIFNKKIELELVCKQQGISNMLSAE